jgi:hypothetical protein
VKKLLLDDIAQRVMGSVLIYIKVQLKDYESREA